MKPNIHVRVIWMNQESLDSVIFTPFPALPLQIFDLCVHVRDALVVSLALGCSCIAVVDFIVCHRSVLDSPLVPAEPFYG